MKELNWIPNWTLKHALHIIEWLTKVLSSIWGLKSFYYPIFFSLYFFFFFFLYLYLFSLFFFLFSYLYIHFSLCLLYRYCPACVEVNDRRRDGRRRLLFVIPWDVGGDAASDSLQLRLRSYTEITSALNMLPLQR